MTPDQLKEQYAIVYKFLKGEERMRQVVFGNNPAKLKVKLGECERALAALDAIKDFAKLHTEEIPEQVELLEVPQRGGY